MWKGQKVSVVFPCYNEEENIRNAVEEFLAVPEVDEVVVVDNNSKDRSKEEILKTRARYVLETRQGYGWALRRGMYEATGDIIFTCEPDGTFTAQDLPKFFAYADEFEVVFGSRTSKSLIWSNANMKWLLRLGNVLAAKLLEYLHKGPCLTDVGCTFKMIKRPAYERIRRRFKVGDSRFSPEFMMHCLKRAKCVEIPVSYHGRVGTSKITGKPLKAVVLGIRMGFLILGYWLWPPMFRERPGQEY